MKNNILKYEKISTIFIILLGVVLHFTFNWFNKNHLVGVFSPINESIWEHLKLLYFPSLLTIIIGCLLFKKEYINVICYKTKSLIIALLSIVIFFYTYTGILGHHIALIDISSFIIAVILCQYYVYKQIKNNKKCNINIALCIHIVLLLAFIIFTFYPPKINLFKDPLTNKYGIQIKKNN